MEPIGAEPIPGLLLPTGEVTSGIRPLGTLRLRNARVACALRLSGKRVLNLGCARGIHSFYMAPSADEVIGIDQSAASIAIAESTRKALGISNVRFICDDIRNPQVLKGFAKFDLVIAWGFLHKINDIFALLHSLSPTTDALSLEWRTPLVPFMSKLRLAYLAAESKSLNQKNIGPYRRERNELNAEQCMDTDKQFGQSSFWEPTPGAVSVLCSWFGYKHMRLLGYGENFHSEAGTVTREWVKHLAKWATGGKLLHQIPVARVHMTFERTPGLIDMLDPLGSAVELPSWDLALQKAIGK